jgi:hypothetical protein
MVLTRKISKNEKCHQDIVGFPRLWPKRREKGKGKVTREKGREM